MKREPTAEEREKFESAIAAGDRIGSDFHPFSRVLQCL